MGCTALAFVKTLSNTMLHAVEGLDNGYGKKTILCKLSYGSTLSAQTFQNENFSREVIWKPRKRFTSLQNLQFQHYG